MLGTGTFSGLICRGVVALAVLCTHASALGQGEIRGTVVDETGPPLPGVTVTASLQGNPGQLNKSTDGSRTMVTDLTGHYVMPNVQSGTYTITFALPGFRIPAREGVVVASGTVRVDAIGKVEPCPNVQPGELCVDDASSRAPTQWSDIPCDAIGLSEHGGLVFTPGTNHAIEFARGGRATLRVESTRRQIITYTASVYVEEFARLCSLIDRLGFEQLKPGYAYPSYDSGEVKIEVTRHGTKKTVRDEGDVGPTELYAVELAIEGVRARLQWKRR